MSLKKTNIAIEVHNLTASYAKKPVLWNVDFSIPTEKLIGIVGPNGSGKTTLLKTIMGLVKPDSGYVKILEQSLDVVRNRVSYVPQRESVDWDFPATVREVVEMGRYSRHKLFKKLSTEDHAIVEESLEMVQMQGFAQRQIGQLSGGQQQRVFLARALARKADIYLLDEPFTGIDAATEDVILQLLGQMVEAGKTVVVVHHDLQTAGMFFDWHILLNTHLVACGKREDVFTEHNLMRTYGGKLNILSSLGDIIQKRQFPVREKS